MTSTARSAQKQNSDLDSRLATADLDRLGENDIFGVGNAVQLLLEKCIRSRRKGAGQEVADALHGRVGAQPHRLAALVWTALWDGLIFPYDNDDAGPMNAFAEYCWDVKRLDVLRAVVDAGAPAWFEQYPGETAAKLKMGPGGLINIPHDVKTKAEWFRVLHGCESYRATGRKYMLLFGVGADHVRGFDLNAREVEAVSLVLEHEPDLPGLDRCQPEFAAQVRRMVMERRIAATTTEKIASSSSTGPRRSVRF